MAEKRLIPWVDHYLKLWGAGRRTLDYELGRAQSLSSVWGRVMNGWSIASAAAGGGSRGRVYGALTGDALEVHVAIQRAIEDRRLTERQYQVLAAHYIVRAPVKWKRYKLNIAEKNYYFRLRSAHHHLAHYLTEPTDLPGQEMSNATVA